MNTFRAIAYGGLLALLSACAHTSETAATSSQVGGGAPLPLPTPSEVSFFAGDDPLVIVAPRGFCIDPEAVMRSNDSGIVLMGDCTGLDEGISPTFSSASVDAQRPQTRAPFDAVISVSAASASPFSGWEADDRTAVLESMIQAGLGEELLGRAGGAAVPGATEVVQTRTRAGTLYVLLQDEPSGTLSTAAPRYWRAFAEEDGRTLVLTVSALGPVYPGDQVLLRTISSLRDAIREANRADI
ncbi:MAG: hypothetical protein AAFQ36_02205 [Pseudomonadota bacterium]